MGYRHGYHLNFCSCSISFFIVFLISWPDRVESSELSAGCDYFKGSWIKDDTYPLYNSASCPFIHKGFDCQRNGRPDKLYLKYKWKPTACSLPRFNGLDFLKKMKGKKILFIGDSISLNMWESLLCMVHAVVPQPKYSLTSAGNHSTFSLPEFGISLEYSHNVFLVDLVQEPRGVVLKLDSIVNGDYSWKGYDILIFNSWHWWVHTTKGKNQPWEFIEYRGKIYKDMDRLMAFKVGLTTWSKWVNSNVDPRTTQVFFQGISPVHNCEGQTTPFPGTTYPGPLPPALSVVKDVLRSMSKPVTLLDITMLSLLRKDGHPSLYFGKEGSDCSHWCLAGVPDSWNEILYALLSNSHGARDFDLDYELF
ncbi:Protein trichome birefringence-like 42 [Hibiscus syriacus]|uniref:Protein trichome birefringence-like 42 n=1 Tax=Hibiscus syriacus TaxID=106335 RepID=A0A6A2YWQ1_HIBSY|nr:protein trichome birefringence-like 41 [Hibiscus syriacus]KAE8683740.1 Protein trichome birefringence-like 42 [Hibiscus syriacus]